MHNKCFKCFCFPIPLKMMHLSIVHDAVLVNESVEYFVSIERVKEKREKLYNKIINIDKKPNGWMNER